MLRVKRRCAPQMKYVDNFGFGSICVCVSIHLPLLSFCLPSTAHNHIISHFCCVCAVPFIICAGAGCCFAFSLSFFKCYSTFLLLLLPLFVFFFLLPKSAGLHQLPFKTNLAVLNDINIPITFARSTRTRTHALIFMGLFLALSLFLI